MWRAALLDPDENGAGTSSLTAHSVPTTSVCRVLVKWCVLGHVCAEDERKPPTPLIHLLVHHVAWAWLSAGVGPFASNEWMQQAGP